MDQLTVDHVRADSRGDGPNEVGTGQDEHLAPPTGPANLRVETLAGTGVHHSIAYRAAKRGLDIALTAALLVALFPVLLAAVIVVKASGLPLFFRQERVGRGGRLFTIYKFDTMRRAPFKLCVEWEDDRVPRACRWLRTFRVDELPQLWNILRGDMTLIGPRPLPLSVVEEARHRTDYDLRELVRPGLTGWAKVKNPNSHFQLDPGMLVDDVDYVRNAGVWLDLKILLATPGAVVRGLLAFRATAQAAKEAQMEAQRPSIETSPG